MTYKQSLFTIVTIIISTSIWSIYALDRSNALSQADTTVQERQHESIITVKKNTTTELDLAVEFLYNNWLTIYDTTQEFRPNDSLRRDEAAQFYRIFNQAFIGKSADNTDTNVCNFSDLTNAHHTLLTVIQDACEMNLFLWHNGKFMPTEALTHIQAITVLIRSIKWQQDQSRNHRGDEYFAIASQLALLQWLPLANKDNYDKPITRGDVAILMYRAWVEVE